MVNSKNLNEDKEQPVENKINNETNTKELELALANISFLYQAILILTEEKDKDQLYQIFLKKISQLLGAEICLIYGIRQNNNLESKKEYFVISAIGIKYSEKEKIVGDLSGSLIDKALTSEKISKHNSKTPIDAGIHPIVAHYHIFSSMSAPIKTDTGVEAIVQLNRLTPEDFTIDNERMLLILLDRLNSVVTNINIQEALKIKTNELIKMNNLMIGRELKMIELKKEIDILKAGL
ncbi:MAG: GAF domain-containing protein [Patescibacteria group bacterium]|nr:GAF domain-containing protein [Patescibacteria group bacterium]